MFGPYEIIETVGQGGMGLVYRAKDTSLDRTVALKVLRDDLRTNQHVVARFQREAEAFASLNHPNIVHIYSVGKVGLIPYIAMEFIDGEPVSTLMKRERRIPWERALSIVVQVAEALESAHVSHIIHRDIKPGNVLISRKNDHAYVTDFGIAKVLTADTQLTIEGSRLGTPQYMSPERCLNRDVTASSDLYSLGVMVFQLITGRLPYESKDPVELIRMIVSEPPNRISDFLEEIPKDVERLIAYLLEKDPKNRPPSAEEWAHLCRRVLEGKPLFEDETAFEKSLQELRDNVPTPTPFDSAIKTNYVELIKNYWKKSPAYVQYTTLAIMICIFGFFAGSAFRNLTETDTLYSLQTLSIPDVSEWYRSAKLIDVSQESLGVKIVTVNSTAGADSQPFWLDSETLLVQLGNSAGKNSSYRINVRTGEGSDILDEQSTSQRILAARIGGGYWIKEESNRKDKTSILFVSGKKNVSKNLDIKSLPGQSVVNGLFPSKNSNDFFLQLVSPSDSNSSFLQFYDSTDENSKIVLEGQEVTFSLMNRKNTGFWYSRFNESGSKTMMFKNMVANEEIEIVHAIHDLNGDHFTADLQFCVAIKTIDGDSLGTIVTFNTETGETMAEMGKAFQAIWHPSEKYILATAPDHRGIAQLWAIEQEPPYNRLQLTFLETGTGHELAVNLASSHLVSTINDQTISKLVVVDVKLETLQDQGL